MNASVKKEVCPLCNITLAPFDPYRTTYADQAVHGDCKRKQEKKDREQVEALLFCAGIATACHIT